MSLAVQHASIAAWSDEEHVRENRRLYVEKFRAVLPLLKPPLQADLPQGGFYLWMRTPLDDTQFVQRLHAQFNVLGLPGSYLARDSDGENPGRNRVRLALVPPLEECVDAIGRINQFARNL
jgi:N-succinyldiaminopimelate aminotransferase